VSFVSYAKAIKGAKIRRIAKIMAGIPRASLKPSVKQAIV
jgi:hypothetical protein